MSGEILSFLFLFLRSFNSNTAQDFFGFSSSGDSGYDGEEHPEGIVPKYIFHVVSVY